MTGVEVGRALVDGAELDVGATFPVLDPATAEPVALVARCGPGEVDAAVDAAGRAFAHGWRRVPASERARALHELAALIRRDRDALARLESLDTGKPLRQAFADVDIAARYFEFYGNVSEAVYGETIPVSADVFAYTLREPFGVTAHIVPWNYPIQISARTLAPALAAGNCCVLKPSEEAPLTPLRLGRLALEAGFPPGVLNVVPGLGEEAGAALAAHPAITHLAFTGSADVGRLVGKAAAENCVPVTLELGGKSPNIVFADADVEAAAPVVVASILQNAGQTCSAGSRLLVEEDVHERLVEEISRRFRAAAIGPGLEDADLGPLISQAQRDRVAGFVDAGRREATLVTGGAPPDDEHLGRGFFWEPTLFDEVDPAAAIAREEIFGPVLSVTAFRGADEALALADSSPYGLIAAVWTRDVALAHTLVRELEVGQVYVNSYGAGGGVELPFSGRKRSGHGVEKGYEAMLAYTRTKTAAVRLDHAVAHGE